MARRMTASALKAQLLRILDEVAAGDEVEVTKHGRPVARLVPAAGGRASRGRFEGIAASTAEDEALFGTGEDWSAG